MIVDPHSKADSSYYGYQNAIVQQDVTLPVIGPVGDGNLTNMFIRTSNGTTFYGDCWPGNSSWFDYLNTNAQNYWQQQFLYENFKGSTDRYSIWNDMNEPSVFSTSSHTMPLDALHYTAEGVVYEHRDLHNAYGALHSRSTWKGLLARDDNNLRPFVLTRSFFLGSQKFGAYWTGDNRALFSELKGSMNMIMSLGVSGHPYGGSDIPGFYGQPTEDLWIMFY